MSAYTSQLETCSVTVRLPWGEDGWTAVLIIRGRDITTPSLLFRDGMKPWSPVMFDPLCFAGFSTGSSKPSVLCSSESKHSMCSWSQMSGAGFTFFDDSPHWIASVSLWPVFKNMLRFTFLTCFLSLLWIPADPHGYLSVPPDSFPRIGLNFRHPSVRCP
jgi:hypothetical protein